MGMFPTFWLIFTSGVSPRHRCSMCLLLLSVDPPLLWPPSFPPIFNSSGGCLASTSIPHRVSPLCYWSALPLWVLPVLPFPSFVPFISVASSLLPFSSLLFSILPSIPLSFAGKSKLMNYEIIPWLEDTHDY